MFTTSDERIKVHLAANQGAVVYDTADFSIVNMPESQDDASRLANAIFNTPAPQHITMLLFRGHRNSMMARMSNIMTFAMWKFLDRVSLVYEIPDVCSNTNLIPLAEPGILLYKGNQPAVKNTKWFNDERANASNFWDLTSYEKEESITKHTKHTSLNWDTLLLLKSLTGSGLYRNFIYTPSVSLGELESLKTFLIDNEYSCQLTATTIEEANEIVSIYNRLELK